MQEFIPQAIEFSKHTFNDRMVCCPFMTLFTFLKVRHKNIASSPTPEAVRLMNWWRSRGDWFTPIDEFQRGHIIGSVNLLPTEIKEKSKCRQIEHHKEKPLIIVDVNGVSSATSAELLTKQGFEKVYVLKTV